VRPGALAFITGSSHLHLGLSDVPFHGKGIWGTYQDAVIPMLGFQIPNPVTGENGGLKVGFAYDYTTSNLGDYNNGSFELFLNYCVPIKFTPKTERHGDVRLFD
jgi:ribulose kinase